MSSTLTRRGLLRAGGAAAALGVAGCVGSSGADWGIEGTLSVSSARQFSSRGCRCCERYASYLREYVDAAVETVVLDDVTTVERRHGVPPELRSCHTLVLDEYVVVGHVPVGVVASLLADAPALDGVALPGMPAGSPGMGGTTAGALTVYAFEDGAASGVYAEV